MVHPLHRDSLQLAVPLVRNVGIHEGDLVSPQEQRLPPLHIPLEAHDPVDKTKLIGDIIVVHLIVVVIGKIPPQEGEVNILL